MGLGNKFKEVKKAYVEANKLLGDLIKVSTEQAAEQHPKQEKVTFHRFLLRQLWLESNSISIPRFHSAFFFFLSFINSLVFLSSSFTSRVSVII